MKHEFPRCKVLAATISAMLGALVTGPVLAQSQDAEEAHDHDRHGADHAHDVLECERGSRSDSSQSKSARRRPRAPGWTPRVASVPIAREDGSRVGTGKEAPELRLGAGPDRSRSPGGSVLAARPGGLVDHPPALAALALAQEGPLLFDHAVDHAGRRRRSPRLLSDQLAQPLQGAGGRRLHHGHGLLLDLRRRGGLVAVQQPALPGAAEQHDDGEALSHAPTSADPRSNLCAQDHRGLLPSRFQEAQMAVAPQPEPFSEGGTDVLVGTLYVSSCNRDQFL